MSDYIIAITGGVASGKSTIDRLFHEMGAIVADADLAARDAVAPGSAGLAGVVAEFGAGVLGEDGALDRPAMRRRVFADADARKRLEAIIHPRVREALRTACQAAPGPYAIASIPLLAEGGGGDAYPWLQRILVVDVPESVQLARLLQRDGIDETLARTMIAAQASRRERMAIADDVLVNDGPLDALPPQVEVLDRLYRNLAATTH
jgi:dephospho-CoA kinase